MTDQNGAPESKPEAQSPPRGDANPAACETPAGDASRASDANHAGDRSPANRENPAGSRNPVGNNAQPKGGQQPQGVRWWAMTDKGRFRANNEDAFLCVTLDATEVYRLGKQGQGAFADGDFVFAVSDGMGGARAGEFASSIALDKITRLFPAAYRRGQAALQADTQALLEELFEQIHSEMASMSFHYEECRGMGATLSLGWFVAGRLHYAHVGDSRIYHLPKAGKMRQLSDDHTHVAWLLRKGLITEAQARLHPRRGHLEMVLGGNNRNIQPQIASVPYQAGDRFLFCSDGINGGISDRVIEDLIRNPSQRTQQWTPAERLIHEAAFASRDNMTAILVELA